MYCLPRASRNTEHTQTHTHTLCKRNQKCKHPAWVPKCSQHSRARCVPVSKHLVRPMKLHKHFFIRLAAFLRRWDMLDVQTPTHSCAHTRVCTPPPHLPIHTHTHTYTHTALPAHTTRGPLGLDSNTLPPKLTVGQRTMEEGGVSEGLLGSGGPRGAKGGGPGGAILGRWGYKLPRPSADESQAPLTSPCPPSNHTITHVD